MTVTTDIQTPDAGPEAPPEAPPITPLDNAWNALGSAGEALNDALALSSQAYSEDAAGQARATRDAATMVAYAGAAATFALAVEVRNFRSRWEQFEAARLVQGAQAPTGPRPPALWTPGMPA